MQRDPVFESLKHPGNLQTLRWELPLWRASYTCPFGMCGELVRPHPLDTPPRNFRELAEVLQELLMGVRVLWRSLTTVWLQGLISAHFMGKCSWCAELAPKGLGSGTSRVGRIEAVEPATGVVMPFFVFVENEDWRCSMWSPVSTGKSVGAQCSRRWQYVIPLTCLQEEVHKPIPSGCSRTLCSPSQMCLTAALCCKTWAVQSWCLVRCTLASEKHWRLRTEQ